MIAPGDTFDRYVVERKLGEGGMAEVWLVRHRVLGGLHALKVLRYQHAPTLRRLIQEGQVQSQLRHPNIVAVTDVIEVFGAPALVLEYVEGPTLDAWLAARKPTVAEAERIFRGILAGVDRAHESKLVHRDLKPNNILLASGPDGLVPKVTDFGIAKLLEEQDGGVGGTRSGMAMGTASYMAPEQMRDAKGVDSRADLWALGCILYELVVGRSPFAEDDVLEIFARLRHGTYEPAESFVPTLPPRIGAVIRQTLVVDRDRRAPSCAALRATLDGENPIPKSPGMDHEASASAAPHGRTWGSSPALAASSAAHLAAEPHGQGLVPATPPRPALVTPPVDVPETSGPARERTMAVADSNTSLEIDVFADPAESDSPRWWPWLLGAAGVALVGLALAAAFKAKPDSVPVAEVTAGASDPAPPPVVEPGPVETVATAGKPALATAPVANERPKARPPPVARPTTGSVTMGVDFLLSGPTC